jgi:hypothetical protein
MNHVINVATKAIPEPSATGRRCASLLPVMLAVIAASTRMHSRPSRKTRTPISRNATVGLVFGCVGSGAPWAVNPCHTIIAITQIAATQMPIQKAARAARSRDDVDVTLKRYHMSKTAAAGRLRFFSGGLHSPPRRSPKDFLGSTLIPSVGFRVSRKQSSKNSPRRDTVASTRDACATQDCLANGRSKRKSSPHARLSPHQSLILGAPPARESFRSSRRRRHDSLFTCVLAAVSAVGRTPPKNSKK